MEEETIDLPADNIEDKKEKIRKLVEEGYTNRGIADRTGIPFRNSRVSCSEIPEERKRNR